MLNTEIKMYKKQRLKENIFFFNLPIFLSLLKFEFEFTELPELTV